MKTNRPHAQHAPSHPVRLAYVKQLPQATQALLGEIHFGTSPALPDSTLAPVAWVGMPLLDGAAHIELWTSEQPVVAGRIGPLTFARNRDVLLGRLRTQSY